MKRWWCKRFHVGSYELEEITETRSQFDVYGQWACNRCGRRFLGHGKLIPHWTGRHPYIDDET